MSGRDRRRRTDAPARARSRGCRAPRAPWHAPAAPTSGPAARRPRATTAVAGQLPVLPERPPHDPRRGAAASELQLFAREARRCLPITLPRRGACPQAPPRGPERMGLRRPRGRQGRGDLSHLGVEAVRQQQLGVTDHPEALAVGARTGRRAAAALPRPARSPRSATPAPGTPTSTPCARCPRCRTASRPPSPARAARSRPHQVAHPDRGQAAPEVGADRVQHGPGAPRARGSAATRGSASAGSAIARTVAGSTVNVPRSKTGISSPSSDSLASAAASSAFPSARRRPGT